ncbi:MAG: N-acetylglucosamine-6-phosphate deacetylase [Acidobacteria bacterium]|nr:N-acetylglucosamine-6-phosphate deacetylase [Acidobacteriota bacterium]
MIFLRAGGLVLPDRVSGPATVVIEGDRIVDVRDGSRGGSTADVAIDATGHLVVPGFIDVHVHGVDGCDALAQADGVERMSLRLPRFGVTAFCPTSIACAPATLRALLAAVGRARANRPRRGARVLPAHLESNFISPAFAGAQPVECLRVPRGSRPEGEFTGAEILDEIDRARPDVGIVTLAPELEGAIDLVRSLVSRGHRVSIGHTGATYEQARAGIDAGARHATHLFNRMTPLTHHEPGVVGAVLESEEVAAELIADGVHVHPAAMRAAIAAKGASRMIAITDGTSGSGMPAGSRATLGGRPITVTDVARLDDGTLAGSVLTMDRAFARLTTLAGLSPVEAALMTSTTPARELGLHGHGVLAPGTVADLVVLDAAYHVVQTWVGGELAWAGDRLGI